MIFNAWRNFNFRIPGQSFPPILRLASQKLSFGRVTIIAIPGLFDTFDIPVSVRFRVTIEDFHPLSDFYKRITN